MYGGALSGVLLFFGLICVGIAKEVNLSYERVSLATYRSNPNNVRTADYEIPCPLPIDVTVLCNTYAEETCYCANTIPPQTPVKKPYYCSTTPYEHTHYIRIEINAINEHKYRKLNRTIFELMTPMEAESILLQIFYFNRFETPEKFVFKPSDLRMVNNDVRFLRLGCDSDYILTYWIGLNATSNTTNDNENVTIEDLGYNVTGILATKRLQIYRIVSVKKSDLPPVEVPPAKFTTVKRFTTVAENEGEGIPNNYIYGGIAVIVLAIILGTVIAVRSYQSHTQGTAREAMLS